MEYASLVDCFTMCHARGYNVMMWNLTWRWRVCSKTILNSRWRASSPALCYLSWPLQALKTTKWCPFWLVCVILGTAPFWVNHSRWYWTGLEAPLGSRSNDISLFDGSKNILELLNDLVQKQLHAILPCTINVQLQIFSQFAMVKSLCMVCAGEYVLEL